jgi:hypothetical protein
MGSLKARFSRSNRAQQEAVGGGLTVASERKTGSKLPQCTKEHWSSLQRRQKTNEPQCLPPRSNGRSGPQCKTLQVHRKISPQDPWRCHRFARPRMGTRRRASRTGPCADPAGQGRADPAHLCGPPRPRDLLRYPSSQRRSCLQQSRSALRKQCVALYPNCSSLIGMNDVPPPDVSVPFAL